MDSKEFGSAPHEIPLRDVAQFAVDRYLQYQRIRDRDNANRLIDHLFCAIPEVTVPFAELLAASTVSRQRWMAAAFLPQALRHDRPKVTVIWRDLIGDREFLVRHAAGDALNYAVDNEGADANLIKEVLRGRPNPVDE